MRNEQTNDGKMNEGGLDGRKKEVGRNEGRWEGKNEVKKEGKKDGRNEVGKEGKKDGMGE